ncbi:hypothetical protein TrLO_g6164 [Triparma laevis f. longispina]|uniref:Uncharacterized protein n=1 Tax=Triparma laevis f. longispina TaxID=1714387 RepID=A0A9W7CBL6_9STRA|nr:hypothetical protein TrLO_g6164 [Triparma laevis f. longispina]
MFASDLKLFGLSPRNLPDNAEVLRDAYKDRIERIRNEGGGGREPKELFQEASIAYTRLCSALEKRSKDNPKQTTKEMSTPSSVHTPVMNQGGSVPPTFDVPNTQGCSEQEMKALMGMFMEFMGMFDGDGSNPNPSATPNPYGASPNMFEFNEGYPKPTPSTSTGNPPASTKTTGNSDNGTKPPSKPPSPPTSTSTPPSSTTPPTSPHPSIWETQAQNYTHLDLKSSLPPPSYSWSDSEHSDNEDDTEEERRRKKAEKKREKKLRRKERERMERREKEEEKEREKELSSALSKKSKILSAISAGDSSKLQSLLYTSSLTTLDFPSLLYLCLRISGSPKKQLLEDLRLGVIKCLLRVCPTSQINEREKKSGRSILHGACKEGDEGFVMLIGELGVGVEFNEVCGESGWTPLHYSVANGHINITSLLLQRPEINLSLKTDPNLTREENGNGVTPLEVVYFLDKRSKHKNITCKGKALSEVKASKKSWEGVVEEIRGYLNPEGGGKGGEVGGNGEEEGGGEKKKKKKKKKNKKKSQSEDITSDSNSTPSASPAPNSTTSTNPPQPSSFTLTPNASSSLLPSLLVMGFSQEQCEDAILACGGKTTTADDLIAWILENESGSGFREAGDKKARSQAPSAEEVEKVIAIVGANEGEPPRPNPAGALPLRAPVSVPVQPSNFNRATSALTPTTKLLPQQPNPNILTPQQLMQSERELQMQMQMQQQQAKMRMMNPNLTTQPTQPYVQPQYPSQQFQPQQLPPYLSSPLPPAQIPSPSLLPTPVPVKSPQQLAAELAESQLISDLKAKQREINRNWNNQRVKQQKEEGERKAKEEIERKEREEKEKKAKEDEEKSKKLAAEAARIEAEMEAHLQSTGGLYTPGIAQHHSHLSSQLHPNPNPYTPHPEIYHDPNTPMYYVDEYGVPVDEYGNPIDPNYLMGYGSGGGAPAPPPVHDEEQFPELGMGATSPTADGSDKKKKRRRRRRASKDNNEGPMPNDAEQKGGRISPHPSHHARAMAEGDIRASAAAFIPNYGNPVGPPLLAPEFVPSGFVPAVNPQYVVHKNVVDPQTVPEFIPQTPLPPPPVSNPLPVDTVPITSGLGNLWGSSSGGGKIDSTPNLGLGLGLGLGGGLNADSGFLSSLGLDKQDGEKAKKEGSGEGLWGGGGTSGGLGGGIW